MSKEKKKNDFLNVESFEIKRCHEFKNGNIAFDIVLNDITIYGCTVVKGKKGDFISFPQKGGDDGKYYSIVYVKLSEEDADDIIEAVKKEI